jgi:ACS family glucarate transporter-like MFS transporter
MNINIESSDHDVLRARSAWLGLVVAYAGFVSFGAVFQFVPPLLPELIDLLALDRWRAGLLVSVFAAPGVALSIPSGQLVDRYGARAVGGTGFVVMTAGTLGIAAADDFATLLGFRALAGTGGIIAVVALQRTVTRLFWGRPLGLPMGVAATAIPLGIITSLNVAGPLAAASGWRTVALVAAAASGTSAVAFLIMTTRLHAHLGGCTSRGASDTDGARRSDRLGVPPPVWLGVPPAVWLVGAVWLCANGAMTGFVAFAPVYLRDLGLSIADRGFLTSLPMIASALLAPLVGWTVDRYGGRAAIMAAGMAVVSALLAAIPTGRVPPPAIAFGLGLAMSGVVTPVLSSPAELLPVERHGRAFGVFSALANVGIFAVPPLAGYARTLTHSDFWSFQVMALVAASGALLALSAHRRRVTRRFHPAGTR